MRRLAAPVLAVFVLAGCSGEQGERAQQLLNRAQTAQAGLTSMSYEMRMTFGLDAQRATVVVEGGTYLKGRRAGDQVMTMRLDGLPGMSGMNMQMVLRGPRMRMSVNGQTFSTAVPASARKQYDWSSSMMELARYVKDVHVREGRVVNGERGSTVSGVIDTEGLLKAAAKLQSLSQATGQAAPDMSDLAENVGDTHAALFIAGRTGLIRSAVIGVSMEAAGEKIALDVTYRLKNVNRTIQGL
jgi:outer membrane murein-binding lipoprotein Lpp